MVELMNVVIVRLHATDIKPGWDVLVFLSLQLLLRPQYRSPNIHCSRGRTSENVAGPQAGTHTHIYRHTYCTSADHTYHILTQSTGVKVERNLSLSLPFIKFMFTTVERNVLFHKRAKGGIVT
jgi:hypothetical protein